MVPLYFDEEIAFWNNKNQNKFEARRQQWQRKEVDLKSKKRTQVKKRKQKQKKKKSWSDEEVGDLIDLFESKPCLWNIHGPSYAKRDEKE